ncbi:MAG: AEC family transporter [Desulfobacter sp.]|nr:MAG: AEC family transporter [Desulfobacter sp.]
MFIQTGMTVFSAVFQLFLISLAAGIMIRRQMISPLQVQALSGVTVNVFLPSLIIAKTVAGFHPEQFENWWILPLAGVGMILAGLFFSGWFFRFKPQKRPLMVLSSMQNGIYIPLPIGQILFPEQFDQFALYCFLLVLGLNPLMWSLGKVMLSGGRESRIRMGDFFSPPLAAIFISVALVFSGLAGHIPGPVISAVDLLGQATVPVAVFVLGATMGAISMKQWPPAGDIMVVFLVKFILVPGVVFAVLYWSGLDLSMPLACSMLMVQGASPPATNLILIVKNYGGDVQTVSTMMLLQYLACILIMPVWIATWQYFSG